MTPQSGQPKMMICLLTSDLTPRGEARTTASCFLNNKQSLKREQQEGFLPRHTDIPPQSPHTGPLSSEPLHPSRPRWSDTSSLKPSLVKSLSWIASLLALDADCMSDNTLALSALFSYSFVKHTCLSINVQAYFWGQNFLTRWSFSWRT